MNNDRNDSATRNTAALWQGRVNYLTQRRQAAKEKSGVPDVSWRLRGFARGIL
jgi:hypothetical protein